MDTKPQIPVVDENDNIIGYRDRDGITAADIYRVTALWVKNSNGEVLIARRSLTKTHNPGKWCPPVAGTVDKGESYDDNIKKETNEELGIEGVEFFKGPKFFDRGQWTHFTQWYFTELNRPISDFTVDHSEITELKWVSLSDLVKQFNSAPESFTDSFGYLISSGRHKEFGYDVS